jgi:cytochrome c-type biogenesis protein CcmH/NrfG
MARDDEIVELLTEIRDGQREALARQHEQLELARAEAERMRRIADESVALQRAGIERMKRMSRIVLPIILLLVALVVWLIFKYRLL